MLNIPEVVKELFMQDGVRKNFRVHFSNGERADLVNKDIIEESVKFTESTCSQQTLRFGLTEASVIEFECVGVENIAGMTIECGIEIDVSSLSRADREAYGTRTDDVAFPFYAVPYGVFVVDKCPRQADMKRRKVTGYTPILADLSVKLPVLPTDTTSIDAGAYTALSMNKPGPFTEITAWPGWTYACTGKDSTGRNSWSFRGVQGATDSPQVFWGVRKTQAFAIRVEAEICAYDELADELLKKATASLPSGNYYYADITSVGDTPRRGFSTVAQSVAVYSGGFRPALFATIIDRDGKHYYSPPLFLSYNTTTYVDMQEMFRSVYGALPETLKNVTIEIRVPISWSTSAEWYDHTGNTKPVAGWPITEAYDRRNVRIKISPIIEKPGNLALTFKSDKSYNVQTIGAFYPFDEVIRDTFLNDVLEITGNFGNQKRSGQYETEALTGADRYKIGAESIEDLWFEEAKTPEIGAARFLYLADPNDTADTEGTFVFNDAAPGGYDLTKNEVINALSDRSLSSVLSALSLFSQNVDEAYYIPIELKMKGLPFLEDGDAIRVEVGDDEPVDTYILRHTISGVQHLVDDIEAQGEV